MKDRSGKPADQVDVTEMRLRDNGNSEKVTEIDTQGLPISLVILMQKGGSAGRFLPTYVNLPELIRHMAGTSVHEITFATFDSRVDEIWHFPTRTDGVDYALTHQHAGDKGAAIKDALLFGVGQLEDEPGRFRRIVLLISQRTDEGSSTTSQSLLERLGTSSTIVYSLTFREEKAHTVREHRRKQTGLIDSGREEAIRGLDDQTAEETSALTGGTSYQFEDQQELNAAMIKILSDFHAGITLGFQPSHHEGGFHSLGITTNSRKLQVTARRAYWSDRPE